MRTTNGFKRPRKPVRKKRILGKRKTFYSAPAVGPLVERKWHDATFTLTPGSTGFIDSTSTLLIPQGVADNNRIGRKIVIKSLMFRCELNDRGRQDTDTVTPQIDQNVARLILYVDKQANGAGAAVTDILQNATWMSYRNLDNEKRFDILYDDFHVIKSVPFFNNNATNDAIGAQGAEEFIKWSKKVDIPITYSGAAGALSERTEYNIGFLYILARAPTVNTDTAPVPTAYLETRVRYVDG